nr:1514_t:CDS:2 [Entrophospora candida]
MLNVSISSAAPLLKERAAQTNQNTIDNSIKGTWEEVGRTGVSAMHCVLVRPTKMLIIDKAQKNPEAIYPDESYAYTTEYDLVTNTFRILTLNTNTFCSAGSFLENGTLIETGGAENTVCIGISINLHEEGFQSLRMYRPCDDNKCDWTEYPNFMNSPRWYNTMVSLPNGGLLNFGGSKRATKINTHELENLSFETVPKDDTPIDYEVDFLIETFPYNLYPTVMVLPGPKEQTWLFLAANSKAEIWDYVSRSTVKKLPDIPGGPRYYPLTGSTALLPLSYEDNYTSAEFIICGGGSADTLVPDSPAANDCARVNITDPNPVWKLEPFGNMPNGRIMGDTIHLPDGTLMFINGAGQGYAGWDKGPFDNRLHTASLPQKAPLIYDPKADEANRWRVLAEDPLVRVYHSVASLLPDSTIFVAGSNPNPSYCDTCEYPTEYRVEIFTPPYLLTGADQAEIKSVAGTSDLNAVHIKTRVSYGQVITVIVETDDEEPQFTASIIHMGFITHSTHMSSRIILLKIQQLIRIDGGFAVDLTMPPNSNTLPPGRHHYLYVLNKGIPAVTAVEIDIRENNV